MKSRALALAAALAAVVSLAAPASAADAAVKRPVAKVAVKKAAAKVAPCSPAAVAKVPGVKPLSPVPAGLTYVRTDVLVDSAKTAGSPTPRRWVNYRGPQVWLSTAVCGSIYRHVYVYSDGQARPWV